MNVPHHTASNCLTPARLVKGKRRSARVVPQVQLQGGRKFVEEWLAGAAPEGKEAQISQCLNDIEGMPAWSGGGIGGYRTGYSINRGSGNEEVFHVSAGRRGGKTATLFYVKGYGDAAQIIAVGHHTDSTTYDIDWNNDFACKNFPRQIDLDTPQNIACGDPPEVPIE